MHTSLIASRALHASGFAKLESSDIYFVAIYPCFVVYIRPAESNRIKERSEVTTA